MFLSFDYLIWLALKPRLLREEQQRELPLKVPKKPGVSEDLFDFSDWIFHQDSYDDEAARS